MASSAKMQQMAKALPEGKNSLNASKPNVYPVAAIDQTVRSFIENDVVENGPRIFNREHGRSERGAM